MALPEILKLAGAVITLIGSVFLLLAAVGLMRMPDFYTRIQAGTKASTLGAMLVLLGIGVANPSWLGKIIILIIFILLTNPISSFVLARAAHFIKIPMSDKTVMDKLEEDYPEDTKENRRTDSGSADPGTSSAGDNQMTFGGAQ